MTHESDRLDDLLNARVVFGLEAQGHIPTIERMLSEHRTWDEIGKAIRWCGNTAEQHYKSYVERKGNSR